SLPFPVSMAWKRDMQNQPTMAMPPLKVLLSSPGWNSLIVDFSRITPFQYQESLIVTKNILRVPLKSPLPEDEALLNGHPPDGLFSFYPVDLYQDNIVSTDGLHAVFARLQQPEGCGVEIHRRSQMYSMLHVDVSSWWSLFRLLYSYQGMCGIRRDLFLCYGFWHPYYYMNIAIGNEFRVPFLGPTFFKLFPDEKKLMRRGELQHNVTLFSWMRLAYPEIAVTLQQKLVQFRKLMISHDHQLIEEIVSKKRALWVENPYRARSVSVPICHLCLSGYNYYVS